MANFVSKKPKSPNLSRYSAVAERLLEKEDPKRVFVKIPEIQPTTNKYGIVDLFAGAGGMSLGFRNAGFEILSAVELVEIAAETHHRNFPDSHIYCGDISEYSPLRYLRRKQVQVVVGGPPCQGFSVAGKRDPNDPRNKLFREFVRVVDELKPDYFVMENVPGILTMQEGKVTEAILEAFEEIGYPDVSVAILETATLGVAQLRSRAIFIGNRHGMSNPFPAPILEQKSFVSIESVISDLPSDTPIPELNHEWTRHSKKFIERISKVKPGESLYPSFLDAYKRQYMGVPSMTIKENHGGTHIHPFLDRCISAREMARLQSFPDSFIFSGTMKKAMWQIGNAVAPLMSESIAKALIPFLDSIHQKQEVLIDEWIPDIASNAQMKLL
jgi:DNA (cytosine-5)-methyltransferase 1